MPAKKMRIEVFDGEGNKYTISFEGQVTRDKALRILDLVELLGGMASDETNSGVKFLNLEKSKYDKVVFLVQKYFPMAWFSSREIQEAYEDEFKEPISLSTVATYLSRMAGKGILVKAGASNRLKYRFAPNFPQSAIKQKLS
ncbi:MAG: hypothetical protein RMJ15_08635 [Nitrososphaerota archaeon]|nr:hypothetical protein [Candidatus Bathyarchaeota archaeon]MDW8023783.1 hypothetical protein [Nitrososphaerota archaeon]